MNGKTISDDKETTMTTETTQEAAMTKRQVDARLSEIAPWPDRDPTPENVARYLAVQAQRVWAGHIIPLTEPGGPEHLDPAAVMRMNAQFAAAHALLALIGTGREDQIARDIALAWSGGAAAGVWIWEHLEHLGVDPDEVTRLEHASAADPAGQALRDARQVEAAAAVLERRYPSARPDHLDIAITELRAIARSWRRRAARVEAAGRAAEATP